MCYNSKNYHPSFMVMCQQQVCPHVGLILVRTSFSTTLYPIGEISANFAQAGRDNQSLSSLIVLQCPLCM